jgi:hypothetical protein
LFAEHLVPKTFVLDMNNGLFSAVGSTSETQIDTSHVFLAIDFVNGLGTE